MKKLLIPVICLTFGALAPALAESSSSSSSSCFNSKMLSGTGPTIRLSNGLTYMVAPGADRTKVTIWLPLDKLRVCHGTGSSWLITNLSRPTPQTITGIRQ